MSREEQLRALPVAWAVRWAAARRGELDRPALLVLGAHPGVRGGNLGCRRRKGTMGVASLFGVGGAGFDLHIGR